MRKTIQFRSSETDLTAKISSMIFDAAVKASTAKYVVDGTKAVDSIAAEAQKLVGGLEAEVAQKDARIAELIGERDSLMDQCHGLQRLADERDGLRMRAATLEKALIEEMAARMWADEIFRYEGHLTWEEVHESEKEAGRQKARAALDNHRR